MKYLKRYMTEFNDNPSQVSFPSQRTVKKKRMTKRQIQDTN
jgi:hypothetical protein